nr:transposase [Archangium violaceum]
MGLLPRRAAQARRYPLPRLPSRRAPPRGVGPAADSTAIGLSTRRPSRGHPATLLGGLHPGLDRVLTLAQLDEALEWGVRRHVVLSDAGYGDAREFREAVRERELHYLMGVQGTHKVWPPGVQPRQPPKVAGRKGRPRTRYTAQGVEPWSIESLARELPEEDWHSVHWPEGSRGQQASRFAAVRVRSAARHVHGVAPGQEEWLLVEWPKVSARRSGAAWRRRCGRGRAA